jgi:hypothetical protein
MSYKKSKRPRLSEDEFEMIQSYRAINKEAEDFGLDIKDVHSGWLKNKTASLRFVNPNFGGGVTPETVKEDFRKDMMIYAPEYEAIIRKKKKEAHLFVLSISDLHIGKLASKADSRESYSVDKAIKRAKEAVNSLLSRASGYEIDKILLPVGNDLLHVDNSFKTTTRGTPQDVDGTWHENFTAARKLFVEIIEQLVQVADVHICHVPSNHDYVTGYCLTDALYCWFNKSQNITFDLDMNHRKYFKYKDNLIGVSHGDGAKMEQLPLLMANEAPKDWATTKYRYIYLGHIHHKDYWKFRSGKDYQGVTVEYLRSPSAADTWHSVKGFQHSKQAIEAFLHSAEDGQVGRITHNF